MRTLRSALDALDTLALVSSISLLIVSPSTALPRDASAQVAIAPVVLSGDPAPGTDAGVTFSSGNFLDLQINGDGTVLFIGGLTGPGVTNDDDDGMWLGRPGALELVVRTGDAAPEYGNDVEFAFLAKPVLGRDGSAGFYARVRGPGVSDDASTAGNDDSMWYVEPAVSAREAITPSSRGVAEFNRVDRSRLKPGARHGDQTSDGDTVATAYYDSRAILAITFLIIIFVAVFASSAAVDAEDDAGRHALVRVAAGPQPVALVTVGADAPSLSEPLLRIVEESVVVTGDRLAFTGGIAGGDAVFFGPPDDLAPIALPGAQVPASLAAVLGDGTTYGNSAGRSLALNAAADIAFIANVVVPPQSTQLTALVAGAPDAPRLVAVTREDGAPGDGFTSIDTVVLNAHGDVAFTGTHSTLGGDPIPARGLWTTHEHAEPVLALAEGQTAPGLESGEVVSFFEEGPFMNARGEVVMRAGFGTGIGFQHTTGNAIWLVDPVAGPQLVARKGGTIDVGGGNLRTLDNASLITSHERLLGGGEDGRATVLNDLGQVVFQAHWQEPGGGAFRSGVFLAAGACDAGTCRDDDFACKRCGQPVGQGEAPAASDALAILRVAVGSATCAACVCDVDASGSVAATDALITLKRAVGQDVSLECPVV
jgi:hypothetical protein